MRDPRTLTIVIYIAFKFKELSFDAFCKKLPYINISSMKHVVLHSK